MSDLNSRAVFVFPAASPSSKLKCAPDRKPPPIDWIQHPTLFDIPPPIPWMKIDTTLQQQRHHHRRPLLYQKEQSDPSIASSSSSSSSFSSYISSPSLATQSDQRSFSVHQDELPALHHYHARFNSTRRRTKARFLGGLVSKMKRAAERPFRFMET
ncbi:hypothetical protein [Absidia glauca]|uniref:Uncharacterized protein n=1 Tax=Absidia glauca TaxID=4829 RepID=A0A163TG40_ABSGL|nr:hypothetical protein [Absidia glauca]